MRHRQKPRAAGKTVRRTYIELVCLVITEAKSVYGGLDYLITTLCYLGALSLPVSNFMDFGHAANNSSTASPNSDNLAVIKQGDSALASAKRNFSYFISPMKTADHPERFRTRAL